MTKNVNCPLILDNLYIFKNKSFSLARPIPKAKPKLETNSMKEELNEFQSPLRASIIKKPEIELTKMKDFSEFLINPKYSDLTIISSDGKELPVHRVILANENPLFWSHKFDSLQSNRLELKNFDSQTIIDCLR